MKRRSEPIHFVVPGPIDQATGGYRYDAAIVAGLRGLGADVTVHELPGRFPDADDTARAAARACTARVRAGGGRLVFDGLALPAFRGALRDAGSVIGLIHHPLWLEERGSARARDWRALEAGLLPTLGGCITTSRPTARDVAALGVEPARIVAVEPGTLARGVRRGRRTTPLRILCVATLTPRKGHDRLLCALAKIKGASWRLDCVGSDTRDAAQARHLRALARRLRLGRRVRFHGEATAQAVGKWYARADLFALASRHEGYGMAFAEAIAHGLPVAGLRAGAVPEVVPASAGILAHPGREAALTRALRRLLRGKAALRRLSRAAYLRRRRFPDWPQQARAFAAALDRLAP